MSRFVIACATVVLAIGGSTACASKKFVRTTVADVNEKVDALGNSVEQTQEHARQNEGRIAQVSQTAQAAQQSAQSAQQSAAAAGQAAAAATASAHGAEAKIESIQKANQRLEGEVVLTEEQGDFAFDQAELPSAAQAKLDDLVSQLKQEPQNVYFEIEGHTDSTGPKEVNERVGLERAEAVEQYLHEHHQVPLHRMNVISFGEEKPVAPNNTRAGRAKNRRVVIRVLD